MKKKFLFLMMLQHRFSSSALAAEKFKKVIVNTGDNGMTFEHTKVSCKNSHYVCLLDFDTG